MLYHQWIAIILIRSGIFGTSLFLRFHVEVICRALLEINDSYRNVWYDATFLIVGAFSTTFIWFSSKLELWHIRLIFFFISTQAVRISWSACFEQFHFYLDSVHAIHRKYNHTYFFIYQPHETNEGQMSLENDMKKLDKYISIVEFLIQQ